MKFSVIAAGDCLFTAAFPEAYKQKRKELDRFLSSADVRLANLETNLSDFGGYCNQYSGGTWLNTRKELFRHLETFGFDFYGTANNHCMDYGYGGLLSTADFLESRGIAHAGTGRSLEEAERAAEFTVNGVRYAVFAADAIKMLPSMAGNGSRIFAARPGVNYLRHTARYKADAEDMAALKRIAAKCGINFARDFSVATGYALPDKEGEFTFGQAVFTSDAAAADTECDKTDLARIIGGIKKKKEEGCKVFVLIHCHDNDGTSHSRPPRYLKEFAHAAIDAGAEAVFGGGCHELRGLEIYNGFPVFYSLGDFIFQLARVEHLPPDYMEKYGLDVNSSAREGLSARAGKKRAGLRYKEENFLTVLPKITFDEKGVTDITLMPVKLAFLPEREEDEGLPAFAAGEDGEKIYGILKRLSAPFGTDLAFESGLIKVKI